MVGKAQVYRTKTDKIIQMDKNQREFYALHRTRISVQQTQVSPGGATPSSAGSSGGTGNFLETQGDTMMGPIAFNPVDVIIVDGRIEIGENSRQNADAPIDYSTYVFMTGQGTPDDLNWIDRATYSGQYLILQGTNQQVINLISATFPQISSISGLITVTVVTSANHGLVTGQQVNITTTTNFNVEGVTITVTNPTTFTYAAIGHVTPEASGFVEDGNIFSGDGSDVALDGTASLLGAPSVTLIFDITIFGGGGWRVIGVSSGGSGNVPVGTAENDHLQWDAGVWVAKQKLEFNSTGPWASTGYLNFPNDTIMLAGRNIADTGDLQMKVTSTGILDIANELNGPIAINVRALHAVDPDNTFSIIQFGSVTGQTELYSPHSLFFYANGTNVFSYDENKITVEKNILPGAGDGVLRIGNTSAPNRFLGVHAAEFSIDSDNRLDFTTSGLTKFTQDTSFTVEITTQRFQITGSLVQVTGNAQITANLDLGGYQDFNEIASPVDPGANIGRLFSKDVSGDTHLFYVNSTEPEIDLTLGGSQTPWLTDIDADNHHLLDAQSIQFRNVGQTGLSGAIPYIHFDDPNMEFNVPSADGYLIQIAGVTKVGIGSDSVFFNGNHLVLDADNDTHITGSNDDIIVYRIGGSDVISMFNDGGIRWTLSGADHDLTPSATAMTFEMGASSDDFIINFNGATTGQTVFRQGAIEIETNSSTPLIHFMDHTTPNDDDVAGAILFEARNTGGAAMQFYASIRVVMDDVSSGSEDSDMFFRIIDGGIEKDILKLDGSINELILGTGTDLDCTGGQVQNVGSFSIDGGEPSITGSRGGNVALASLLTALENLGLIFDNTS